MNARAIGLAVVLVTAGFSLAGAQPNPLAPPTSSTAGICGQPDHLTTHPFVVCNCYDFDQIRSIPGCENVYQVVCINDFQYNPPALQAIYGDIAWINLEFCGDFAPEDLVVNTLGVGCDPHHEVLTTPPIPGLTGDTLDFKKICSPNAGVTGSQVPTLPPACDPTESNVRCYNPATTGFQHYTCMTNPGHTALMHGFLAVP